MLTQPDMDNAGYVLPAFAIVSVVGVFIAALAVGALTGTTGSSILGVLAGLPVAFALGSIVLAVRESGLHSQENAKHAEMRKIVPALLSGNKEAIAQPILQRKAVSVP